MRFRFRTGFPRRLFTRQFILSKRGISTIMANLTMLVIVVFLSSMLFIWSINSFGGFQAGAGLFFSNRGIASQERLAVENVWFEQPSLGHIFIRNVGSVLVKIGAVYIDGTQYATVPLDCQEIVIGESDDCTFTVNWTKGQLVKITVATKIGTVFQTQWVV